MKDVVNCIGGVQVLFPLLEQIAMTTDYKPVLTVPRQSSTEGHEVDDWVYIPTFESKGENELTEF